MAFRKQCVEETTNEFICANLTDFTVSIACIIIPPEIVPHKIASFFPQH